MTLRVFQVPSPKHYQGRSDQAVIALVHHRMVGTLKSTDATFTTGDRVASTNFGVGYDCGRSGHPTGLPGAHVHQYVAIDDAAWGNGNLDPTGQWDDVYGATPNPNYRTISIEHHDNGGAPLGSGRRGVVPEEVLAVSIELDRLLLSGDWAAWKAAGIKANTDATGERVAAEVGVIVVGPDTLVDHHYIAGRLKPYCWRPWADDPIGFPQARYLTELGEDNVTITVIKGEDWIPAGGVRRPYRSRPERVNAAIVGYIEPGETVRTIIELSADGEAWRLSEIGGAAVYILRADITPVVAGGDPVVDAELSDYIARVPDQTPFDQDDLDRARADERTKAYIAWKP
jgi:hypothetical protein